VDAPRWRDLRIIQIRYFRIYAAVSVPVVVVVIVEEVALGVAAAEEVEEACCADGGGADGSDSYAGDGARGELDGWWRGRRRCWYGGDTWGGGGRWR